MLIFSLSQLQKAIFINNMWNKGTVFVKYFDEVRFWQICEKYLFSPKVYAKIFLRQEQMHVAAWKKLQFFCPNLNYFREIWGENENV